MTTEAIAGAPGVTPLRERGWAAAGARGRSSVQVMARPGISVAASAPIAMVVWATVPGYRPPSLVPFLLAVLCAGVLVLAAELASFDNEETRKRRGVATSDLSEASQHRDGTPELAGTAHGGWQRRAAPPARHLWSDPAMVGVDRWLGHWPGVAGVGAVSWWAARLGTAGLLAAVAFRSVGVAHAWAFAGAAVAVLVVVSLLPAARHLVHVSLALVALCGVMVTVSGLVSLATGDLGNNLLPAGEWLTSHSSAGTVAVDASTTVVILCLAAASLPALTPVTAVQAGRAARWAIWAIWATIGATFASWACAIPALLRAAGLSSPTIVLEGGKSAELRAAVASLLQPLAGRGATVFAGAILCVTLLAAALGAAAAGTGLAETAMGAVRAARAGLHGPSLVVPGAGQRQPSRTLPLLPLLGMGLVSSVVAGTVAAVGPRGTLVVALGSLAAGALALTTLSPPVLRRCQRVPRPVRAWVGTSWVVVVTVAIGSAGPVALAVVGVTALSGAFAMGWRGRAGDVRPPGAWRDRHLALPWGTAAAALVATTAVTSLEVLPVGGGNNSPVWRGLAVVVMGASIVLLAIFPATSRLRAEHLVHAADTLSYKALPALAKALEGVARGEVRRAPTVEMSELEASTRRLETELDAHQAPDELVELTRALVEASRQVTRVAIGLEAVAQLDSRRLEELVEERTAALSNVNRHLADSQLRRRQLLDRTVRVAEGERARIAANLHDGPIQRLAALGLVLDRCRLRLDRDDADGARELVKRARTELSAEIQNLRQMMSELRPPILDEGGLDAAIRDQVSAWGSATGTDARFESWAHARLSANSETVLYRVVQEALANVAKHAKARLVTVTVNPSGSGVSLTVCDDGKGFDEAAQPDLLRGGHFGLVVMRERVELAAGRFEVRSAPDTGTQLTVWLPAVPTREPVGAA